MKRLKLPAQVLERARAEVRGRPSVPPPPKVEVGKNKPVAREKVVAMLKRLHPMD